MIGGYSQFAQEKPLKPYQQFAVKWQLDRLFTRAEMGAGLFLDPGLGKTRITLSTLDFLFTTGEIRRALIVAPLRPIYLTWPDEIAKWGFSQTWKILHGNIARNMLAGAQIEFLNYEGLKAVRGVTHRWDMVVLDESTWVKTWSTKRMSYLREILRTIPRRSIMTGTPAANSLADLHAQMYVVDNGVALGKNVTYFRNHYMIKGGYMGRQWILREDKKGEILSLISGKVLRMQAEDHLDMPRLVINDVWCEMPPAAMKQYRIFKRELAAELDGGSIFVESQSAAYAKCKQMANGTVYRTDEAGNRTSIRAHDAKIDALDELAEELAGKPILIFYHYTQDLMRIKALSRFRNAPTIRGKDDNGRRVKQEDVKQIADKWNAGKIPYLICQWQAAGHGLNLQEACNDVACFGVPDSPEVYDQAYRRVYRQGVKGSQVRIHRLLTKGTVDEVMLLRLNGKFDTQDQFLRELKKHARS